MGGEPADQSDTVHFDCVLQVLSIYRKSIDQLFLVAKIDLMNSQSALIGFGFGFGDTVYTRAATNCIQ